MENRESSHPVHQGFLPINREEMELLGWDRPDFVLVTGDAYVDHPSFGAALIGRWLQSHGYRVALLPQPDWKSPLPYKEFGRPKLGFLVTAGNLDSILANYTASLKPRRKDAYSPGGIGGRRPDHASVVYSNRIREAYKGVPIILGGIEASLRRFAHYDLKDQRIRRSILFDSRADLLTYGLAETTILEVAEFLKNDGELKNAFEFRGTARIITQPEYDTIKQLDSKRIIDLPSYEEVASDPELFAKTFVKQEKEHSHGSNKILIQKHADRYLVQYPPSRPLDENTLDCVFDLPYTRKWHPAYDRAGGVPAIEEVLFSITSHRGCFGGCSFCALTFHQGKTIQKRSDASILQEAKSFLSDPRFKGYIHDIGGPTANFRENACQKLERHGPCPEKNCIGESICNKVQVDHSGYLRLLRTLRSIPGIKKVFIRSGIRYDYVLADSSSDFIQELCEHHVSGQLKVAPEHSSPSVLQLMNKPSIEIYEKFKSLFQRANQKAGKKQFLVPYLMSSHPGSTLEDAIDLALKIKEWGVMPEQVQDFIPAPGSLSTAMFVSGINPITGAKIHVPTSREEKDMQRALLQFQKPENHFLVRKALQWANRTDLIGNGPHHLVPPAGKSKPGSVGGPKKPGKNGNERSRTGKKSTGPHKARTRQNRQKKN